MMLANTLLYWKFFYLFGSVQFNDFDSYVHPVFLYLLPAVTILIEYCLNSVIFDYKKIIHLMVVYIVYLPFTYLGKFVLGYYPYAFLTWNTWYSYFVLLALALLLVLTFFVLAFISNSFKKKYIEK